MNEITLHVGKTIDIESGKEMGIDLHVWTVNNRIDMERMMKPAKRKCKTYTYFFIEKRSESMGCG